MITYESTKLLTQFLGADSTDFKLNYIGKTNRCIIERIKYPNVRDNNSHLLKYAHQKGHTYNCENYFKILDKN